MSPTKKKIAALTKEIEQKNALLSDLSQKAKEELRRADTRKKILYGGAFLAYLTTLSPEQKERVKAAIDAVITNKKDRQFLELDASET
jgi:hypothetical protein